MLTAEAPSIAPAALGPVEHSWVQARNPEYHQASFLREFFPGGDYHLVIAAAGAYPIELRLARPSVGSLRLYASLLKITGQSAPAPDEYDLAPVLPIAQIGPILVVAHYHPAAAVTFPMELVQLVIVPVEDYRELRETLQGQLTFVRDFISAMTPRTLRPWPEAKKAFTNADKAALHWVESLGLVQGHDMGMVKSAQATADGQPISVSSDYQIALQRITHGSRIGRFDIGKFRTAQTDGITPAICERYKFHPFAADAKTFFSYCLSVADVTLGDFLASKIKSRVVQVVVSKESLALLTQGEVDTKKIDTLNLSSEASATTNTETVVIEPREMDRFDPRNSEDNQAICKWLLWESLRRNASDLHLENHGAAMLARGSIDGTGVPILRLPRARFQGVSAVLKTLSGIDLDGTNHDEGRFTFSVGHRTVDARVSLLITVDGPKWTLRFFDKSVGVKSLAQLGLSTEDLATIRQATRKGHGIILVSGPTGHGKSTTLNACLNELISQERFIYTLEDPVEFKIEGASQIVATSNAKRIAAGEMSFADGIKRLLRAAPHVILVTEIRDAATADSAVEASMTGHLVLSTVHANDSAALVHRMVELGADARLLSETVVMAASQRLARRLCQCQSFAPIKPEEAALFEKHKVEAPRYIHTKTGCQHCDYTGYKGRVALLEFLTLNKEIRKMVASGAGSSDIREVAVASGFRSLFVKGLEQVHAGITSIEEIQRVCPDD